MIKSDLSPSLENTVDANIAITTTTTTTTTTIATASATARNGANTADSSEKKANFQNKHICFVPLVKATPSAEAYTLTNAIIHLFSVPQEEVLAVATEFNVFTSPELKITQALLSHLGQESVLFTNLYHETGLSCNQISKVIHALKHFEILSARQSVLRFVKQADPQQNFSDQLDCFGSHRSIRLGCAEQYIAGAALSMVESQVFYLLKQRKVVQPSDFTYFVNNPADRKAFFRFLVWGRLFNKVFMDNNQLLHFVPKYKVSKVVPNPSHTSIPVASDPSSTSSNTNTGNSSLVQGSVDACRSIATKTASEVTSASVSSASTVSTAIVPDITVASNSSLAPTEPQNQTDIKSESTEFDVVHVSALTPKLSLRVQAEALLFPLLADAKKEVDDESTNSLFAAPDVHHGITIIVNPKHNSTVPRASHVTNDSIPADTANTAAAIDSTTTESTDVTMFAPVSLAKTTPSRHDNPMVESRLAAQLKVETAIGSQSTDSAIVTTTRIFKATTFHSSLKRSFRGQHNSLSFMNNYHSLKKVTESSSYR